MPRKRQRQQRGKAKATRSKMSKSGQGPLSNLVDLGANTIKGIGRGIVPGLFKTTMAEAPNNVGIVAPRAMFKISNNPQRIAEFDPDRSIRVSGCGLFTDPLTRVATRNIYVFNPTAVNPFPAWRGISPMSIDPRMMQIAITYQYYSFRMLRFTYIPVTGTSGPVSQTSLGLGISQDSQEFIDLPTPTLTQMLEQNNSILTPAWCPTTLSYVHDGTRVWRTDPASEGTIDEVVQCLLGAVLSVNTTEDSEGGLGDLYVEYVCDLYEPQPVLGSGTYTVALPYNTVLDPSGVDAIQGIAFMLGSEYPAGYNPLILPPAYDYADYPPPMMVASSQTLPRVIPGKRGRSKLPPHLMPPRLQHAPPSGLSSSELTKLRALLSKDGADIKEDSDVPIELMDLNGDESPLPDPLELTRSDSVSFYPSSSFVPFRQEFVNT